MTYRPHYHLVAIALGAMAWVLLRIAADDFWRDDWWGLDAIALTAFTATGLAKWWPRR